MKETGDRSDNVIIEDCEDETVNSSEQTIDIEHWEREWQRQKRRLGESEVRECLHESPGGEGTEKDLHLKR